MIVDTGTVGCTGVELHYDSSQILLFNMKAIIVHSRRMRREKRLGKFNTGFVGWEKRKKLDFCSILKTFQIVTPEKSQITEKNARTQ